jgi:hypothetical protein
VAASCLKSLDGASTASRGALVDSLFYAMAVRIAPRPVSAAGSGGPYPPE